MGLIEIVLAGLCFSVNYTCPGDEIYASRVVSAKEARHFELAEQLKDQHLIITTLMNGGLSGIEKINGSLVGNGVAFDVLEILQNKYGFNYSLTLPKNNVFGGSTDGVLSMLKNENASLAAAFMPILNTYRKSILYSPSLDTGEWVVMMKRPKESATGSGLLAPFTFPVWILIILSLLVVGPIIYLVMLLECRLFQEEEHRVYPLPSCIWFVYGALLKQGTTLNPVTDSSRLLFSTWWIFITILTAFYTANLTAFLTLSKFTLPISEPSDIGSKHYPWVTNRGNALQDVITTERSIYDIESKKKLEYILGGPARYLETTDAEILQEYVKKKDIMFIRETPMVEYIMYEDYKQKTKDGIEEEKRCTFVNTKFSVTSIPRAFAYSKSFKYYELFDSTIQYLVESGIIKYKLRKELPDTQICPLNLGNKERRLRNSDLTMTYQIVGGGLGISLLVFIIELARQIFVGKKFEFKSIDLLTSVLPDQKNKKHNTAGYFNNNNYNPFVNKKFVTPPPAYNTLFNPPGSNEKSNYKKKTINGREYWIVDNSRLVPLRTPSALLFQFTN